MKNERSGWNEQPCTPQEAHPFWSSFWAAFGTPVTRTLVICPVASPGVGAPALAGGQRGRPGNPRLLRRLR